MKLTLSKPKLRALGGKSLLAGAAMGLAYTAAPAAFAQDAPTTASRTIDVVTVQARKKDESLQDVPVAISSIGSSTVQDYNLTKIQELSSRIPTLAINVGGSGSSGSLRLRGIGSSDISAAFDSAIALDIDGVIASSMRIVSNGFLDVEQVDLLKGPQTLYFGKSSSGGVLSFRSKNPSDEFEAGARVAYEIEEEGFEGEAYISGPITDTLGARLVARFSKINETALNTAPGVVNPERGEENFDTRLTLDWTPTERFNANFKIYYSRYEGDGGLGAGSDIGCIGDTPQATQFPTDALGFPALPSGYDCDPFDGILQLSDGGVQAANFDGQGPGGIDPFAETEIITGRLRMTYDLTDELVLTSVTGLFRLESDDTDNYSYDIQGVGTGFTDNRTTSWSQEFRLESQFGGMFDFMLGAYYQTRDIKFFTAQHAFGAAQITSNADILFVLGGGLDDPDAGNAFVDLFFSPIGADPITGRTDDWRKNHTTETDAWSVFGNLIFRPADRWEINAGLRYSKEDKTNTIDIVETHLFLSTVFGILPGGTFIGPIDFEDDNLSPEITVRYDLNDNVNLYAAYKTGFKSGGIDNSALPSGALLVPGFEAGLTYESESAEGGEIGFKSTLFDGTFRLNGNAFYYIYDDLQIQSFDAINIQFETFNASEIESYGAELDFVWLPPIDGLTVTGALAYTHTDYSDTFFSDNVLDDLDTPDFFEGVQDLEGRAVVAAPRWSGNIGLDYVFPVGNGWEAGIGGLVSFSSSYFLDDRFLDDVKQGSYAMLDLSARVRTADGRWQLSVIANNVTDKIVSTQVGTRPFAVPDAQGLQDLVYRVNRGRKVFIELKFTY